MTWPGASAVAGRDEPRRDQPRRDQRGAASIELVLVVPVLVVVLGLFIAGGRLWFARSTVVQAAESAARAASLARSGDAARHAGVEAAHRSLATAGLVCASLGVDVDVSAFGVAVGTPAAVHSDIRCRVPFADLAIPMMPGGITVDGHGVAALDTYRAR